MTELVTTRTLAMPRLGFGTWQLEGADCVDGVHDAISLGYRHVDTARAYGNEREVAAGIREAGVPRDELWLTTKVWRDDLEPDRLRASAEASLRDLGVDHVDLLLVHWPNPAVPLEDTLSALTRVRDEGLARHVGVSNFPSELLRQALALAPIACDQVEYHPYLSQRAVLDVARAHGIVVTAYSPLASGSGLLREPVLAEICEGRGCSPAQVVLRWLLDQGNVAAVPRAGSQAHRLENLGAQDLVPLTAAEQRRLDALERGGRVIDPPFAPDWD